MISACNLYRSAVVTSESTSMARAIDIATLKLIQSACVDACRPSPEAILQAPDESEGRASKIARLAIVVGNIWQFYCQAWHCFFSLSVMECDRVTYWPGRGAWLRDAGSVNALTLELADILAEKWSHRYSAKRIPVWRMKQALQWLWYDRPVRTQLMVAIGAISLIAALAGGTDAILNTRTATRVEIEASLEIAQRFVAATLKDLQAQNKLGEMREALPLQLKQLRHVRILLIDSYGNLTVLAPEGADRALPQSPSWFSALVRRGTGRTRRARRVGRSFRSGCDRWRARRRDRRSLERLLPLALVWLVLDVLVLITLYVVLGRVLDPLQSLSRGMQSLEDGHYGTRIAKNPR